MSWVNREYPDETSETLARLRADIAAGRHLRGFGSSQTCPPGTYFSSARGRCVPNVNQDYPTYPDAAPASSTPTTSGSFSWWPLVTFVAGLGVGYFVVRSM